MISLWYGLLFDWQKGDELKPIVAKWRHKLSYNLIIGLDTGL